MIADLAQNASTPASSVKTAPPPLRLLADGLCASEQANLGAILDLLAVRLPQAWVQVQGDDADLYVHTHGAKREGVRANVTALLVRDDEPEGAADQLWMPVPLRVMAVLDLLHGAYDRLQRASQGQAAVHQDPPAAGNDETALAASLARLFVGTVEHSMRVRILGFGTLYACPARDTYRTDFDFERMDEVLKAQRFILTAISSKSGELDVMDAQTRPLDELLWSIGLMTPRERQQGHAPRQRLRNWPDFARLPHEPAHLMACAALSTAPMNLQEVMAASGLDETQADRFLHACELCRLLEEVADAPRQPAPAAPRGGLFDRLWRRLVK